MKNIYAIVIFVVASWGTIVAQTASNLTVTDSLDLAYKTATSDTARLNILLKDRYTKYFGQADQAIDIYKTGFALAEKLNKPALMSKIAICIGALYGYSKAEEGTTFQWYQKALSISEAAMDFEGCQNAHYAIGIIYDHQGFRDKMYQHFLKSFEYSERLPVPSIKALTALIENYTIDKRFDDALAIAKRGVVMVEKPGNPSNSLLFAYSSMLNVLKAMPDAARQKAYYAEKVGTFLEKVEFTIPEEIVSTIGASMEINRPDLAMKYATQVLQLKDENDIIISEAKESAHQILAKIYEARKNYPMSIQHLKEANALEIQRLKNTMTRDAGRQVIKIEAERNLLIKQQELNRQQWVSIAGFSIAALILLGVGIVFRYYRREQIRKRELAELNQTKDRLMSIVAHDLRSPIGLLKDTFDLLDNNVQTPEQAVQFLSKSRDRVDRVYDTLENLLVWALSQRNGLTPQFAAIPLRDFIAEQQETLRDFADRKAIAIQNDTPQYLSVWADKNQLSIVVNNILNNALKFTPSGGTIRVSAYESDVEKITLQISDTGIGMDVQQQEQNTLLHSRKGTENEKGIGIGLSLVREIVDKNGGTMRIESQKGVGTNVFIILREKPIS
jgi:signal transduction histidine kinase